MKPDPSASGAQDQSDPVVQEFDDLLMQYVDAVLKRHVPVQPLLTGAPANLVVGSTRLSLPALD